MSKKDTELNNFFSKQAKPSIDSLTAKPLTEKVTVQNKYDQLISLENELILEKENIRKSDEQVFEINPNLIKNWEFHDRPENELGDIDALAREFIEISQQQPCIVRPIQDSTHKFELIAGERRWRAAKQANLKLKVIIKNLDDSTAALVQAAENSQRKDLSDYAKGMSYAKLIDKGVIRFTDLTGKLKISNQQLSRLLAFSKLPSALIETIQDFSKISARTADELNLLCSRDISNVEILCNNAEKIRTGKVGANSLNKIVEDKKLSHETMNISFHKVFGEDGRHIFTWRQDGNKNVSISFPRDITKFLLAQNKGEIECAIKAIYKKAIVL